MAEAAAGARLDAALLAVRGDISIMCAADGTYSLTLKFNPRRFLENLKRTIFRGRKAVTNTFWPLTPSIWAGVSTTVVVRVVTAQPDSWWRSGGVGVRGGAGAAWAALFRRKGSVACLQVPLELVSGPGTRGWAAFCWLDRNFGFPAHFLRHRARR